MRFARLINAFAAASLLVSSGHARPTRETSSAADFDILDAPQDQLAAHDASRCSTNAECIQRRQPLLRPRPQRRDASSAVQLGATGSVQSYTVASTGTYFFSVAGGQGGFNGQQGTQINTTVHLQEGQTIDLFIGQAGVEAQYGGGGGGGGGSFVLIEGTLLLAAGGGGGGSQLTSAAPMAFTDLSGSGQDGTGDSAGMGGNAGGGGAGSSDVSGGAGGAGFIGPGGSGAYNEGAGETPAAGGQTFDGGLAGGGGEIVPNPYGPTFVAGSGGYGGGGGGGSTGGGGGGGYSGGGGGGLYGLGGGGGSYVSGGQSAATVVGSHAGDGVVYFYQQT